jgi:hypothetical protein
MARRAHIIGFPHGSEKAELIAGPEVPVTEQHRTMARFAAARCHEKYALVQLFEESTMNNPTRQYRMLTPEEWEQRQRDTEKAQAAHDKFLTKHSKIP